MPLFYSDFDIKKFLVGKTIDSLNESIHPSATIKFKFFNTEEDFNRDSDYASSEFVLSAEDYNQFLNSPDELDLPIQWKADLNFEDFPDKPVWQNFDYHLEEELRIGLAELMHNIQYPLSFTGDTELSRLIHLKRRIESAMGYVNSSIGDVQLDGQDVLQRVKHAAKKAYSEALEEIRVKYSLIYPTLFNTLANSGTTSEQINEHQDKLNRFIEKLREIGVYHEISMLYGSKSEHIALLLSRENLYHLNYKFEAFSGRPEYYCFCYQLDLVNAIKQRHNTKSAEVLAKMYTKKDDDTQIVIRDFSSYLKPNPSPKKNPFSTSAKMKSKKKIIEVIEIEQSLLTPFPD